MLFLLLFIVILVIKIVLIINLFINSKEVQNTFISIDSLVTFLWYFISIKHNKSKIFNIEEIILFKIIHHFSNISFIAPYEHNSIINKFIRQLQFTLFYYE